MFNFSSRSCRFTNNFSVKMNSSAKKYKINLLGGLAEGAKVVSDYINTMKTIFLVLIINKLFLN